MLDNHGVFIDPRRSEDGGWTGAIFLLNSLLSSSSSEGMKIVIHIRYKNIAAAILFYKVPCLICTNLYARPGSLTITAGVCKMLIASSRSTTSKSSLGVFKQVNLDRLRVNTLILQRNQSCGNGELSHLFLIIIADGVSIK